MKILCLSRAPLDYIGGIPSYCLNLYRFINFEVENFSYDLSGNIKTKKVRFVSNIKETLFPSQLISGTIALSIEYFLSVVKNSNKFSILHVQHPDPLSAISAILAKLKNKKLKIIVSWHADIYMKFFYIAPFLMLIDILLFSLSTKLIYFSPSHVKTSLFSNIKFIKKKILIIPLSIPTPNFNKVIINNKKTTPLKNKNQIKIISIGRLVKYKGYEYALKAISKLNKNIKYTIIGDGPLKEKINLLIIDLNLSNRVTLLGKISEEEKNKELYSADIFLFPSISQSEAYGLVQLEAMYFNLPIINTNLKNGVNYLVPDNVSITCKPKNPMEINRGISRLINNDILYTRMARASRNNLKRFNHSEMIESYNNLFNNLKY